MICKQEQNNSILSLSSDSEPYQDTPTVKKDKAVKRELSENEYLSTENKNEIDDILLDHDGESSKNQALKVNSSMKKLEKEDENEKPLKKTNINSSIIGGKEPIFESWCFSKHPKIKVELIDCILRILNLVDHPSKISFLFFIVQRMILRTTLRRKTTPGSILGLRSESLVVNQSFQLGYG